MDIKPDNLVLDVSDDDSPMFVLKIIDFNLSITHANHMVEGVRGTEGYMAPEVEERNQYWPMLADRYSCGTCMEVFLEQGQDVVGCHSCYKAVAAFAANYATCRLANVPHSWSAPSSTSITIGVEGCSKGLVKVALVEE